MNFIDAIKTCFSKYVDFNGRARRSEYWFFLLLIFVVNIVAGRLDKIFGITAISTITTLALLLPGLAVAVRRLHDIGKRWMWFLLVLIPVIGWIFLMVFYCTDSQPGENQFGPNPKENA